MNNEYQDDDGHLLVGGDFVIGGSTVSSTSIPSSTMMDNVTSTLPPTTATESSTELTDHQERVLSILFVFSGLLSIMGSLIIIYKILLKKMLRPIVTKITINSHHAKHSTASGIFRSKRNLNVPSEAASSTGGAIDKRTSKDNGESKNGGSRGDKSGLTRSSRTSIITTTSAMSTPTTPYDRIMLGLSIYDVIASLSYVLTPFMGVASVSDRARIWSVGNPATCTMMGVLQQISFGAVWYNCMLSYYYLATIKFGMKRHIFAQRIEIWIHVCTTFYFGVTAIFGAIIGFYSEVSTGMGCWVNDYPKGCNETEDCLSPTIGWIYGGIPVIFTIFSLIINNIVIYFHVRSTLRQNQRTLKKINIGSSRNPHADGTSNQNGRNTSSGGISSGVNVNGIGEGNANEKPTSNSSLTAMTRLEQKRMIRYEAHIRQVMTQGLLYVVSFFLSYTPAAIIRAIEASTYEDPNEQSLYPILVLYSLLLPLQGFFNMFVYNRPTFLKLRDQHPELSWIFVFRLACFHDHTQLSITKSQAGSGGDGSSDMSYRSSRNSMRRGTGGSVTTKAQERRAKYYNSASSSGREFSSNLDAVMEASREVDNFSDSKDSCVDSEGEEEAKASSRNEMFVGGDLYKTYTDELKDQSTTRTQAMDDDDRSHELDENNEKESAREQQRAGLEAIAQTPEPMELDDDTASSSSDLYDEDDAEEIKNIVANSLARIGIDVTSNHSKRGLVEEVTPFSPTISHMKGKVIGGSGAGLTSPVHQKPTSYKRISFDGTIEEG